MADENAPVEEAPAVPVGVDPTPASDPHGGRIAEAENVARAAEAVAAKWVVKFENGVKVEVDAVSGSRAVAVARRALHDVAEKVAVATAK